MGSLLSLSRMLNKVADNLDSELKRAKTTVGTGVVTHLVQVTPVDTSEALSNWQASTLESLPARIGPIVYGEGGSSQAASSSAAIADAVAVFDATEPHTPLAISNPAPYIRRLNDGWSQQHPGAFVEEAVLVGRTILRNFRLKLRG